MRNPADAPTSAEIRNNIAIPFASQIPNDSQSEGDSLADVVNNLGDKIRVIVEDIDIVTLNDEQSVALGGPASKEFCPVTAILQCVGVGGTIAGDGEVTIGITSGGTQILAATASLAVLVNEKLVVDLSAVKKPAIPANSTIYVKVTKADTTGTAGSLINCVLMGEVIPSA